MLQVRYIQDVICQRNDLGAVITFEAKAPQSQCKRETLHIVF